MKQNSEKALPGLVEIGLGLEDLIRRGAREVIQQAVEAELAQLLEHYENVKTLTGQRAVVRNGYLPGREVLTAVGPVAVQVPKVRDRSGSGVKYTERASLCLAGGPSRATSHGAAPAAGQARAEH